MATKLKYGLYYAHPNCVYYHYFFFNNLLICYYKLCEKKKERKIGCRHLSNKTNLQQKKQLIN